MATLQSRVSLVLATVAVEELVACKLQTEYTHLSNVTTNSNLNPNPMQQCLNIRLDVYI